MPIPLVDHLIKQFYSNFGLHKGPVFEVQLFYTNLPFFLVTYLSFSNDSN